MLNRVQERKAADSYVFLTDPNCFAVRQLSDFGNRLTRYRATRHDTRFSSPHIKCSLDNLRGDDLLKRTAGKHLRVYSIHIHTGARTRTRTTSPSFFLCQVLFIAKKYYTIVTTDFFFFFLAFPSYISRVHHFG